VSATGGIRYVVVGLGTPEIPATDEDCEMVRGVMEERLPFKPVVLSERVSSRVTVALVHEMRDKKRSEL
jgi:hypothetical protein